ncbi:hypothetical protein [Hungatella hathewayi]|uniref:hypothetical protein n=1 Tax=Hungatella hathewayi TaxID=154046 RepID=UPI0002E3048F|nr:hypothetical protein [Hungatella hathewayi]
MRRRSYSIDGLLQRMMTVAGILLALMILGKAVGMADWNPDVHMSSDNRSRAAQCLIGIWKYSYPAGKASEQITGGSKSGPPSGEPRGAKPQGTVRECPGGSIFCGTRIRWSAFSPRSSLRRRGMRNWTPPMKRI